jgi:hypothetical protein
MIAVKLRGAATIIPLRKYSKLLHTNSWSAGMLGRYFLL